MHEIHYFFTPILDTLIDFDSNDWYLYPLVTLETAKKLRDQSSYKKDIEHLNASYDRLHKITLDLITVTLYGRKYGRQFVIEIQKELSSSNFLDYNNQVRQDILHHLNITTADFIIHRHFTKKYLRETLHEFHHRFSQSPATLIYPKDCSECLEIEAVSHSTLKNYLPSIEKIA